MESNECRLAVSLTVQNLSQSLHFYQKVLGFAIERVFEKDGNPQSVALKSGSVRITLNQDDGARGWGRTIGEGFSLRITTDLDLDEFAKHIRDHGVSLDSEPADMPWGARVFRLQAPDGFKLSFSSPH